MGAKNIWRRIMFQLDPFEADKHHMLVYYTMHIFDQYKPASQCEDA